MGNPLYLIFVAILVSPQARAELIDPEAFEVCHDECREEDRIAIENGIWGCSDTEESSVSWILRPCTLRCLGHLESTDSDRCFCKRCYANEGAGFCGDDRVQITKDQCESHVCNSDIATYRGHMCSERPDTPRARFRLKRRQSLIRKKRTPQGEDDSLEETQAEPEEGGEAEEDAESTTPAGDEDDPDCREVQAEAESQGKSGQASSKRLEGVNYDYEFVRKVHQYFTPQRYVNGKRCKTVSTGADGGETVLAMN